MRVIADLSIRNPPSDLAHRLEGIFPQEHPGSSIYWVRIPENDTRFSRLLDALHSFGYRLWEAKGRQRIEAEEYNLLRSREYDDADLEAAPYVEFEPIPGFRGLGYRNEQNRLYLDLKNVRGRQGRFCFADHCPACNQRTKEFLHRQDFIGAVFRPALVATSDLVPPGKVLPSHEPWWELSAEPTLPPASPFLERTLYSGKPAPAAHDSRAVDLRESGFIDRELHYLRAEIEQMKPFDLAQTFELPGSNPLNRPLVCSQRFYHFCRDHDLHDRWRPVRIDEG